ncbi:MAG: hypothetical protein M0R35_03035 [Candidatus Omnitrophica bacterium]|jgi:hypothetical protein|nr:hypothetical protein [Candidatus Omnitrophota bacterium]
MPFTDIPVRKMLKNSILFLAALFILSEPQPAACQQWQEIKGDHFIVYHSYPQDARSSNKSRIEDFGKEVARRAEIYYGRIAIDLGYPRYSEFWTWDKRVKIYLYPDKDSFIKASSQPYWSEGMADYTNKKILGFYGSRGFLYSVLPHEIAHLIFRDFVGFKSDIPLWLDEGVAQWEEEKKRGELSAYARDLLNKNSFLSLEDMMGLDVRHIVTKDNVYMRQSRSLKGEPVVMFLTGEILVNTYYIQAASLAGFMINKYGSESFAEFCRQLRDGKEVKDAILSVYYTHIRSLEEFEDEWVKYVAESG